MPSAFPTDDPVVGLELLDSPPAGFRVVGSRTPIGTGEARWRFAVRETMSWGIKLRSGFRLASGTSRPARRQFSRRAGPLAAVGEQLWLALPLGPLWVREPVRVSLVVDEDARQGFAYATRPGHQLDGEELFLVERDDDDEVWLTVCTVSRPARGWRWAAPLLRLGQLLVRRRYLKALAGPID